MSYTPAQLSVISRLRSPLKAEAMTAEISEVKVGVSGAGHPQIIVTLAPLENNTPQTSLALRHYVSKIDAAIERDPKALGRAKEKAYQFFRAVDPAFPVYPHKVSNGVYQSADGATLNYAEYDKLCNQVTCEIFARLEAASEDTLKPFVGKKVFMKPQEAKVDEQKRVGQFVAWIARELKEGEDFISSDLVDNEKMDEIIKSVTAEE